MDPVTTGIGALILAFGLFSAIMRLVKPGMFKKLEPMKEKFGPAAGSAIHFIAYAIIPLAAGTILIIAGMLGMDLTK